MARRNRRVPQEGGAGASARSAAESRATDAPAPPATIESSARSPKQSATWLAAIALVVVAATCAVYANSLGVPFLLDDPINVTKNPQIAKPLDIAALARDPRAVVTASLRWNYLAGEFSVTGYHVLNVVAHALTGLLVLVLSWRTLRLAAFGERYAPVAHVLAGLVALIFVLHPMQTESVTYVIQRAEIFVSAALLGSLIALTSIAAGARAPGYAMLAAFGLLGAYSKPSFAVLPALLVVYDLCFLSRGRMRDVASRWPAYAAATALAAWTFVLTQRSGGFEADTSGFDLAGITPADYLSAQFGVVVRYLGVALWPDRLCFDCGYRGPWPVLASPLGSSVAIPLLLLAALAAAAVAAWKKHPLVTFAVFGSAVVLAPTSSFVPLADFYVEHRMYLPIAFLAMAVVPGVYELLVLAGTRAELRRGAHRAIGGAVAAGVLVVLASLTVARNRVLADPIRLMEDALEQAPQNERVHYNLANAYRRNGRLDEAIPHYEAAIRLLPHVVRSYQNLGSLYLEQGKLEKALEVYLAGVRAKPGVAMAHRNVAMTYLRLDRPDEALAAAKRSLEIEPTNANGHRIVGDSLVALGRHEDAADAYRAGLASNPNDRTLQDRLAKLGRR